MEYGELSYNKNIHPKVVNGISMTTAVLKYWLYQNKVVINFFFCFKADQTQKEASENFNHSQHI
jgi:hypothetical protein